ncbi:MAG: CPBP family intramembrane metalloprotease [Flavobacteriaceae bacterium]|nr:CPBP family intramembrane metalloprotease [Flavobacteriaceae bacterium]
MTKRLLLSIEFLILFVLLPLSLTIKYNIRIKAFLILLGFVYIIFVLLKNYWKTFENKRKPHLKWFWKRTFMQLGIIIVFTTIYMYVVEKSYLFYMVIEKPQTWLLFVGIYSLLSVYPQELIYRTFYFKRYKALFSNTQLFIYVNAIIFSLAHLFFGSLMVQIITLIGGLIFAWTYHKTQSTFLVSIQHAIYGSWLFSVGMGPLLGFPG